MHYYSVSYRIFSIFNYIFLALLALFCIAPLLHVLAVSFSARAPADANLITFWPIGFNVNSYKETIENDFFISSFINSFIRVAVGTVVSMCLILLAAYSLAREKSEFPARNIYAWIFVFTMLFNGGLVPLYIVVQNIGLMNTIWALIMPQAVNVFNMILLLNFFRTSVPKSLEEAAKMDGAGHLRILWSIYLPISKPAIATISLFTIVFHWNEWFYGLIFLTQREMYPLATLLQTIIVQQDMSQITNPEDLKLLSNRTVQSAQIFIAMIPIILIYPFLQKFFVQGIVLGSVKE